MTNQAFTTYLPQKEDDAKAIQGRNLALAMAKPSGTALALAARTATTQSADISCLGMRSVMLFVAVNVASGTGGLTIMLRGKDPTSGAYFVIAQTTTAIMTATNASLQFGPGCGAALQTLIGTRSGAFGGILPDTIRVEISHADASSYTYSVGYSLSP